MKKIDLLKAVEQYKELSEQIAMLKNQQDALADCIKQVVGEAEELLVGPYMIRYKTKSCLTDLIQHLLRKFMPIYTRTS